MSARLFHSLLLLAALPMAAQAQAPANDLCSGAQVLTFDGANLATSSIVRGVANAAATPEVTFPCGSTTSPPKNSVWFTFAAPVTGTYGFETCGTSTFTNIIGIYTGTCAMLTPAVPGACVVATTTGSACSPGARMFTSGIDAGSGAQLVLNQGQTYYVQVAASLASTTLTADSQFSLRVGVEAAAPPNDTCTPATMPVLTLNQPLFTATRAANRLLAANDAELPADGGCLQMGGAAPTATSAAGQDVAVRFTAPQSGNYSFRASNATVTTPNTVLYLTSGACLAGPATYHGNGGQCVAAANRGSASLFAEEVSCVPLTGGTDYTLWVDALASSTGSAYLLEAAACFGESETNDQPNRANALSCPVTGNLAPAGDIDFFEVGDYPGAKLFALVELGQSGTTTTTTDSQLRVTTAADTVEFDDNDATSDMGLNASLVANTTLPSGTSYLRASSTAQIGPYRLHSMLKFGPPTPEAEPNNTRVTATRLGSWIRGALPADGTTSDVDVFSFDVTAGELVFVALDASPDRSGVTPANINFEIFDALGWSVGIANDSNTTVSTTASTGLTGTTPAAPAEGFAFRASTTGTHYVHVTRTTATATLSGDYVIALSIGCGMVQPTLTSVSLADGGTPVEGTVLGGDTLTLLGSNFDQSSIVRVGGARGVVTQVSPTSLTVTTPSGNMGPADVSVTNFGNLTSTRPASFTYFAPIAPPSITSVPPSFGPAAGGQVVTLTGTLFKSDAEVSFTVGGDTQPCTNVIVADATQLSCRTTAITAGIASVTVRNAADNLSGSLANAYTFVLPPTFNGASPATGLTLGGATITLTGTGFLPGATVRFGNTPGTGVSVAADGLSLTVVTPIAGSAGPVSITVRNSDGQQVVAPAAFTYRYPAPTFLSVTPASGFASGGQVITLTGSFFLSAPAPSVTFDGVPAPSVSRTSATQLEVLTPAGMPGPADVEITNNDGQTVARTQAFTFVSGPTVLSVSPTRGRAQGGTRVTISGRDFAPGARVAVGGVPAFAPTVVDPSTIVVVTNSGQVGAADVTVENPDTQSATLPNAFTFDAAPTLSSISPSSGTIAGGTVVTVSGSGFRPGTTVQFGLQDATGVTVVSSTTLTAMTPASPLGVVAVRVINDDGQAAELARAFRFVAPPTLTAVAPGTGDVAGGTVVRLSGTHFGAMTTVSFDGLPAERVSFVNDTTLEAVTPAHGPGAVEVVVTNPNSDTAALAAGFLYTRRAPTLESLAPASGLTTGGMQVNVTGTGFAPNTVVTFGGVAATAVVMASPSLLRVIAPAHPAGAVDLTVTNDDGQLATLPGGFLFVAPPQEMNVVRDGGNGGLVGDSPDGGAGPTTPTGCGCSSLEGSVMAFAALGLLLRRRSKRGA